MRARVIHLLRNVADDNERLTAGLTAVLLAMGLIFTAWGIASSDEVLVGGGVLCLTAGVAFTGLLWVILTRKERLGPGFDAIQARRQKVLFLTSRLQESAQQSADLLAELEADIAEGTRRADEVREKVERNTQLAALNQEQLEAVGWVFGERLGKSSRRGLRQSFMFLVLGAVFGKLLDLWWPWS